MTVDSLDLEYLRDNHPHRTSLYMSVYVPGTVYVCTVNGDHDRGSALISVNSLSGDINDIEAGMTAIVGTGVTNSLGNRRRVRSIAAGPYLRFDDNEDIWEDGTIIVVLRIHELWPVYPKYVESANTFFKDGDVSYNDENEFPPPVAIVTNNHNVILKTGAIATEFLDGSDSYTIAPGATISGYLWESSAGSLSTPTSASTFVTFNTTYKDGVEIKLTVTDSNGNTQTTYRYLFVVDLDGTSLQAPYTDFALTAPLTGSFSSGGWKTTITLYGDASSNILPDFTYNTLIILWQRVLYNTSEHVVDDRSKTILVGYVLSESVAYDAKTQTTTFEVATIDSMMQNRSNMFSVSLEDVSSPSDWYQYKNLTLGRAVHHFWKYHSTLLDITNVFIGSLTEPKMYATDDFQGTNLYNNVQTFTAEHGNFSHVLCDKHGQVHLEKNINMMDATDRDAVEEAMTLTAYDIRENPVLVRRRVRSSFIVLADGVSYNGSAYTPHIAKAPGETPYVDGASATVLSRLAVNDQDEINMYAGRKAAIENDILDELRLNLAGNYSFIDIVPQRWFLHSLSSSENNRGIEYTNDRFIPRTISLTHDASTGVMQTNVIFEHEAEGADGITGDWPTDIPTVTPPPDPPDPPTPPTPTSGTGFGTCYVMTDDYLARTRDLSAASPSWTNIATTATYPSQASGTFYDWILNPWAPATEGYLVTSAGVYKSTNLDQTVPTFSLVLAASTIESYFGAVSSSFSLPYKIIASINIQDFICILFKIQIGSTYYFKSARSYDGGSSWDYATLYSGSSDVSYLGGFDYHPHLVGGQVVMVATIRVQNAFGNRDSRLYKSTNSGGSWSLIYQYTDTTSTLGTSHQGGICCHFPYNDNPDGDHIFAGWYNPQYNAAAPNVTAMIRTTNGFSGAYSIVQWTGGTPSTDYPGPVTCKRGGIESYTNDRQLMYAWVNELDIDDCLYVSSDAGVSWSKVSHTGLPSQSTITNKVYAAGGFPTNSNQFYVVFRDTTGNNAGSGLYVSIDRGVTWIDKTGDLDVSDFHAVAGSGSGLKLGRAVVVPLWTE